MKTIVTLVLLFASVITNYGAPAPYVENFDSYPDNTAPAGFVTASTGLNTSASWAVLNNGASGVYRGGLTTNQGATTSAISISGLSGVDFVFSTTFVLSAPFTGSGFYDCQVGIIALAGDVNLNFGNGYRVNFETFSQGAPFIDPGSLSLFGTETSLPGSGTVLPVVQGTTYTMTLAGTYTGQGLLLTASLSDGINSISRSGIDSMPATGTYFGYYNRASASTQRAISYGTAFDNFSVAPAVPEPGAAALTGSGLALLLGAAWKRRRSR